MRRARQSSKLRAGYSGTQCTLPYCTVLYCVVLCCAAFYYGVLSDTKCLKVSWLCMTVSATMSLWDVSHFSHQFTCYCMTESRRCCTQCTACAVLYCICTMLYCAALCCRHAEVSVFPGSTWRPMLWRVSNSSQQVGVLLCGWRSRLGSSLLSVSFTVWSRLSGPVSARSRNDQQRRR